VIRSASTLTRVSLAALFIALVLTPSAPASASGPLVLNGRIVFQKQVVLPDGTANRQLWIVDKDGSNLRQLTTSGTDGAPTWSPSGRFLAFFHSIPNISRVPLEVMDMRTGSVRTVAQPCPSGPFDRPAWSPDGAQLIFTDFCPGWPAIWKVNADGTGLTEIRVFTGGIISTPSWSPDGSKILFSYQYVVNRSPFRIFTINPNGGGLTRLTQNLHGDAFSPEYSPDGSKIVYEQDGGTGTLGIIVMNADGTDGYAVSHFDGWSVLTPSWSPDGRWIVFSSAEPACDGCAGDHWDLFVTRSDGSGGTRRLTLLPSQVAAWYPTWQPRFPAA
jgi:Tol biopolymer transport system component